MQAELVFENNDVLVSLYGPQNEHLKFFEREIGLSIRAKGNRLFLDGTEKQITDFRKTVKKMEARLQDGRPILLSDLKALIQMEHPMETLKIGSKSKMPELLLRSDHQASYLQAIEQHDLVFATGPAGTGKTYLAVAKAVSLLLAGKVDRLVLSRPAVEAGEQLGFLPGDLQEKINPYLRPIYDALYDFLPAEYVGRALESGTIEIAPLAFMRGRTLSNVFVILDEAQNTTPIQMKMALTRLGENSKMVVTGDLSQTDLPHKIKSGLREAIEILEHLSEIAVIRFQRKDVVRHKLVEKIIESYDQQTKGWQST